jgi:hypothetical protein
MDDVQLNLIKISFKDSVSYTYDYEGNTGSNVISIKNAHKLINNISKNEKITIKKIIKEEIESISGDFYALVKNDRNKISIIGVGTKDQVNNKKKELESRNKGRNYSVAYTLNIHKAPKL